MNWKPTQDALETDGEARRAGVTVLLGIGASPGLTNLLARHSADQLDEVDYIQTVWGSVGGRRRPRLLPAQGSACPLHEPMPTVMWVVD